MRILCRFRRPDPPVSQFRMFVKGMLRRGDRDFAWKVRWRMRHDRNPLLGILQDKYLVREYAQSRGVEVPRLIHVTQDPETIPFDSLPRDCFIKATHGCGWNIRCVDSVLYFYRWGNRVVGSDGSINHPKAPTTILTRDECIALCRSWLSRTYSTKEWAYTQITPRIIVEETLVPRDEGELKDYRMYTFNGTVATINVDSPAYRRKKENVFFDPDWNQIPLTEYKERVPSPLPARPACLEKMVETARRLGRGIDFARIDLYDTARGCVLGEVTMYPEAGQVLTPTSCRRFNLWLGDQWALVFDRDRSQTIQSLR